MANIFESMNAVMEDCGFIGKDSTNLQQKYKFRGIDAVMNALNPAFRKHKVFVVPEVLDQTREERTTVKGGLLIYSIIKVKYTFYAEDGSHIESVVIGEGMDSGDKASNKAMSAAFKYACFQAFCIPTEEMKDSEDDSPEPTPKKAQVKKTAPKEEPTPDEAARIEEIANAPIGLERAIPFQELLEKHDIPVPFILSMYSISRLSELTERQAGVINASIHKIKNTSAFKEWSEANA